MKNQPTLQTNGSTTRPDNYQAGFLLPVIYRFSIAVALLLAALTVNAQSIISFGVSQTRITVPVGATNSITVTNSINLTGGTTNALFDVSGLPAGAGAVLTDTNGNPLLSTTMDTNLWITINTTNIQEGSYVFRFNAGGFDTNGLPVTNSYPIVLQAAHIWNGSLQASNGWSDAASWLGGVPAITNDVVFTDIGAQTNTAGFTNSFVTANTTIGSLRFSQTGFTNSTATNPPPVYNHVHLKPNVSLTISGTNGFSILRDYFDDLAGLRPINITISGDPGSKLIITNQSANATVVLNSQASTVSTLDMSALDSMLMNVSRVGLCDYQIYPNYRDLNTALNVGNDTNDYHARPSRMTANIILSRTNVITATYVDAQNYTNEFSRGYAFNLLNNEQEGIASSTPQNFFLGISNVFLMDGICFYGANGNGTTWFNTSNSTAVFRNTNGTSAMSMFVVSDGGGTNEAGSNMKGTADFSGGTVDILADRFYVARDRQLIPTNNTPNIQGTVIIGKGKAVLNSVILGYQEHTKPDWTLIGGGQPYLDYCQGTLTVTNGGTFSVKGSITLGYTADTNSVVHAQQYNTFGRINIYSNSTVAVSNIICDGGLNFYDANLRANSISLQPGGTLVVTNAIGGNNYVGTDLSVNFNPGGPGLPLDTLTMSAGSTLTLFVAPGRTNAFVRSFSSSGTTPGIIKIASLPTFPVYPTNITLIKYVTATPFVAADMSAVGGTVQGYIINNTDNSTIDLFLTTNAAKTVTWTGNANNNWDLTTTNWVATNAVPTTFSMGDVAVFNDSTAVTNVNVTVVVVPNQAAAAGVVISNSVNQYIFTAGGGSIAGTAKILKQGTNLLTFAAAETGPFTVTAGALAVDGGSALVSSVTISSNVTLNVTNSGTISGSLISTGIVTVASGSQINGNISLQGGSLVNDGNITMSSGVMLAVDNGAVMTNTANGKVTMNGPNSGNSARVSADCTLANFGVIISAGVRLTVSGLYYGTGSFYDPVNPPAVGADFASGNFGRLQYASTTAGFLSVGATPYNSIGRMTVGARLDMHASSPANNAATFLVEVDSINNTNDNILCTRWNNIGCIWNMTNWNGSFSSGQSFRVLVNQNGVNIPNIVDNYSLWPLMQPTVPGPGLQWNMADIQKYGLVGITNCTMKWNGGDGTWNTNGTAVNWQSSQVYGDNQGAVFDDSASGTTAINLTTPVAPAGLNFLQVTNIVVGVSTNVVQTSNAPSFMPGIVVSNAVKDYTFTASAFSNRITGMTSIYKTGPGTLTLLTSNDFAGGMVLEGGILAITNASALGVSPPTGQQKPAYDQIVMDNATIKYMGPNTNQSLGRPLTFNAHGATFEVSSNTMVLTLNQGIVGTGGLTKTGPGVLVLTSGSDIYAGGTTVNAGTLRLSAAAAGPGGITLANNTTLELTNGFTFTNAMNISGTGIAINVQGLATNVSGGAWTGGGAATITTTNPTFCIFVFNGDMSGFGGTLSFGASSNAFRFNNRTNDAPCTGSASATFDLGTGSAALYNISKSNLVYNLGALAGGPNTTLSGSVSNGLPGEATTYSIGGNGSSTTFNGKITNGVDTVSIVKVGTGGLLLNGISTYTGTTIVTNGVLGGTGSIASTLTVTAGGTLSPGASIGTFTVSNNATFGGKVLMELNQTNSPRNCDLLVVTGPLTGGGALVVTNIGPDIINGTKFTLFSKLVTGFTVTLPAANPSNTSSYTWQNDLATDGSITLVSGGAVAVNTNSAPIVTGVTNGTLTMGWPADHIGWSLQVQTNPLSVGLYTNWFIVPGSSSTNSVSVPMNPDSGSVFYRLRYP